MHRIERLNLLNNTEHKADVSGIINVALSELEFEFKRGLPEELRIMVNDIRDRCERVQAEFEANFDTKEEKYVLLADEFREYFRKKGFVPKDTNDAKESIDWRTERSGNQDEYQYKEVNAPCLQAFGKRKGFLILHLALSGKYLGVCDDGDNGCQRTDDGWSLGTEIIAAEKLHYHGNHSHPEGDDEILDKIVLIGFTQLPGKLEIGRAHV